MLLELPFSRKSYVHRAWNEPSLCWRTAVNISLNLMRLVKAFAPRPESMPRGAQRDKTATPSDFSSERVSSYVTSHRSSAPQTTLPSGVSGMLDPPERPVLPALRTLSPSEFVQELKRCKMRLWQALNCEEHDQGLVPTLRELVARSACPLEPLILLALAQRLHGDSRACVEACDKVLAIDPENRFAVLHRTAALHDHRSNAVFSEFFQADAKTRNWAAKHPDDSFAAIVASIFPVSPRGYGAAEQRLQHILLKEPENVCILTTLMAVYAQWNHLRPCVEREQASLTCAQRVLQLNPRDIAARLLLHYDREGFPRQFPSRYCVAEPRFVLDYPLKLQDTAIQTLLE